MAYFSKETIIASYEVLSHLSPGQNPETTKKISAIRYLLALDMFYKQFGKECNISIERDVSSFIENVGKVVAVNNKSYTSNFYFPLSHKRNYTFRKNFYYGSAGKKSRTKPNTKFDYPGASPLMYVKDGNLIEDPNLIKDNLKNYISEPIHKTALVIWLMRDVEIDESSKYSSLKKKLETMFSQDLIDILMPAEKDFNQCCDEIGLSYHEEKAVIDDKDIKELFSISTQEKSFSSCHFQQIFYGAPGTGKSFVVKIETDKLKKNRVVRTTFHPDSDYSTFVGAYKPTTVSEQKYDINNIAVKRNGVPVMEQVIIYEFVEQAFLQAYINAWTDRTKPECLIIEEINRGNCAQIFGDLFQLLDRRDDGFSEYAIRADKDLQKHLSEAFKKVQIDDYREVKDGTELLLPGNLYIWATMNTSDQSLFPIDSAFKRRWDWKYVPIAQGKDKDNGKEMNWKIDVDGAKYDWWNFIEIINKHVFDMTNSEDKQLGFFFCKAKDNIISAETFVSKVVFYLWNDVFKDFGFDNAIFKDENDKDNPKLSFHKFYKENGEVNVEKIKKFFENLGIKSTEEDNKIVNSKIEVNGERAEYINAIPYMAIIKYVNLNPKKTAQEVVEVWRNFDKCSMRSWIVCNEQDHDEMEPKYANYSVEIECADRTKLWVNKDGWMHHPKNTTLRDTIEEFINAVNKNKNELGITITETPI